MPEISRTQNTLVGVVVYGFWGLAIAASVAAEGARRLLGHSRPIEPVRWNQ